VLLLDTSMSIMLSEPPEHWTSSTVFFLFYLALCQYDALDSISDNDEPSVT